MSRTTYKQKSKPISSAGDNDLPGGWVDARLEECATLITKGSTPTSYGFEYKSSGISFVRVENLLDGQINRLGITTFIDKNADETLKRSRLQAGDLLFSIAGTIGRTALVQAADLPANTNQALAIIRGTNEIWAPQFLRLCLTSSVAQQQALSDARGGGMNNISLEDVRSLRIPTPPLAEQKRIVARIEELLTQVNATRVRLTRVAQILTRFRQAVLAAVCSDGEPQPLREVVRDIKYGTAQKCSPVPTGSPVLRIPNIGEGAIKLDDLKYAKLPPNELAALRLLQGDILMIRSNGSVSLVGKTALISEREAGFAYAGYLIRLRANCDRILPEYLNLALQTHSVREQIEIPARSTSGVHNINSTEVLGLMINVPETDTQRKIVGRVQNLFVHADAIEKQVAAATKHADKLTQAILAKAIRGELVPTEAELAQREGREYEPASSVLERIKAERQLSPVKFKKAGPRRRG